MQIVKNSAGSVIGVTSWTTGFKSIHQTQTLRKEAEKNLLAVINRLHLAKRYEEAEELFDEFA